MIGNNTIHHTAMDVDPRTLVLKAQVRRDPAADAQLVESIRLRGVLQPIVVTEENHDEFVVLAGHRRTLAAIEAGLAMVPITIVGIRTEADRIADQLAENDQRAALPVADRVTAFDQLALIGLTAEEIAQETSTPVAEVEAALKVAASNAVADITDGYGLTLDELAAVADFEDDPEAVEALTRAAQQGAFTHTLQRYLDDRTEQRMIAEERARLEENGMTVIDRPDNYWSEALPCRPIHYLNISEEEHAGCPGRLFTLSAHWGWDHGERVKAPRIEATEFCDGWKQHHPEKISSSSASGKSEDPEERRRVRESNAAWRSATTVRRAWVTALLASTAPPKGAALFVANSLLLRASAFGDYGASQLHEDLGLPKVVYPAKPLPTSTTDKRALMIALGYALASHEGNKAFAQSGWRYPEKRYAVYLGYLQEIGYGLSEIETACLKTSRKAKG